MNEIKAIPESSEELKKPIAKYVLFMHLSIIIQAAILFAAAGQIRLPQAWLYFGIVYLYTLAGTIFLLKFNPRLINERMKVSRDAKSWDKVILRANNVAMLLILPVAGLDIGRFQWSNLGTNFVVSGLVLFTIANALIYWAMAVNAHFEPWVRIQKDRGHRVITTGPYKFVRHPGYLAGIILGISMSFILGSAFGLVPAGISVLILITRTWLEDKTLHDELDGYSEYAQRVRYRLVPGIW